MRKVLLGVMATLRFLPLPLLRALGAGLGILLWTFAKRRKHVVKTNLMLCFPELDSDSREQLGRDHFKYVVQALLDRSWLWHGIEEQIRARIKLKGDAQSMALLQDTSHENAMDPLVIFAPHFVGLDAGWTALGLDSSRALTTIFTQQSSLEMDEWVYAGRMRFGQVSLFRKVQGVSEIVRSLKSGSVLYLLPDMDFGPQDTVFVPFYGQNAATVTSLSRFAKVSKAKVLSVVTQLTPSGYEVRVSSLWGSFPSDDVQADTKRMNLELQSLIKQMPAQYYWVHRRFKTRPPGEPSLY